MPELTETEARAAAVMTETLAARAAALHIVFMRCLFDILSNKKRSRRDASRALKAQNQCRIALRLLLKLRALEQSQKKSRNRTNELMKTKIVPYDQKLAEVPSGTALCSHQRSPQKLDFGHGVEKIATWTSELLEKEISLHDE